jgi:hypothetical protein
MITRHSPSFLLYSSINLRTAAVAKTLVQSDKSVTLTVQSHGYGASTPFCFCWRVTITAQLRSTPVVNQG